MKIDVLNSWCLPAHARRVNRGSMQIFLDDRTILGVLEPLALAAGRRIMEIFHEGFDAKTKADCSPVTKADQEAETLLLAGLRQHFPGTPIVAEEEISAGILPKIDGNVFFLVDPLDGTKEFIAGKGDFTVNIALVRDGKPVTGVVYAPMLKKLYSGCPGYAAMAKTSAGHEISQRSRISARARQEPPTIVVSRSHYDTQTDAFITRFPQACRVTVGSSLKFCLVASGKADIYPRMSRTMQWDIAAGDAVLRAAGGITRQPDGGPFYYGPGIVPHDELFASRHFVAEGLLSGDLIV